ncbi:mitochondrial import inner membrane translocase subunit TIM50-like [Olea europaea subsp. europaea]|uniref:Mitochondrial import inner membrane translocase subunit TIM50 n=1 Tax=Olea europaea subsp. europaea TaxID=158383 RepID=A0A8S0U6F4_OLEEU|nr:mitochondrial import inner membrane translocase subunit TIM50-like [Olea europaea subsp. europaea]
MSAVVRSRTRIFSINSINIKRFSSNVTAGPLKESIISSSRTLNDHPPSSSTQPPPAAGAEKKPWNFLKYGLIAALTGGVATAGYATYAYSLDEIDHKTKAFRASANHPIGNSSSSFDKFQAYLSSAAMAVPAKLVDLYIDLRRLTEEHVRGFTEPNSDKLLPDMHPLEQNVFTIVLDLNETLIYSDWKRERGWRTFKRPGVDAFLEHLAQFYEIIVFSDQQIMEVDQVVNRLDPKNFIRYRLSRVATRYVHGKHFRVGRPCCFSESLIYYVVHIFYNTHHVLKENSENCNLFAKSEG